MMLDRHKIAQALDQRFVVEGLSFRKVPIGDLPEEQAVQLINALYSPEERFAQGFYKYRVDILKHPEKLAWQNTLEELKEYSDQIKSNLGDPYVQTVGFMEGEVYHPVGIYCLRPLEEHKRGAELIDALTELGLQEHYAGSKGLVHSFSLLKDYRNLQMLRFIFLSIGISALQAGYQHLFFFMSDYRLKGIYKRYGLHFPAGLKFRNSHHTIGCYPLSEENITQMIQTIELL